MAKSSVLSGTPLEDAIGKIKVHVKPLLKQLGLTDDAKYQETINNLNKQLNEMRF